MLLGHIFVLIVQKFQILLFRSLFFLFIFIETEAYELASKKTMSHKLTIV
jgi:hypothetical protein